MQARSRGVCDDDGEMKESEVAGPGEAGGRARLPESARPRSPAARYV